MRLKLNRSFLGHAAGTIIRLRTDAKGNIKERFWRDRLRDAEKDGCVQVVDQRAPKKGSKKTAKPKEVNADG